MNVDCPVCRTPTMEQHDEYLMGEVLLKNWWVCRNCEYAATVEKYLQRYAPVFLPKKKII